MASFCSYIDRGCPWLTIVHGDKFNEFEKPSLSDFYTDIGLIIFQYLVRCFVAKKTNKEKISPFKTIKKKKIDIL
jgi:hypothetical protein